MSRAIKFLPGMRDEYIQDGWNPDEVAQIQPMSREAVNFMLTRRVDGNGESDGRSEWMWVRLPNGDLMCGFFPHGDSYFSFEQERLV